MAGPVMLALGDDNVLVGGATSGSITGVNACINVGVGASTGDASTFSSVVVSVEVSLVNSSVDAGTGNVDPLAAASIAPANKDVLAMGVTECCMTLFRVDDTDGATLDWTMLFSDGLIAVMVLLPTML